MSLFLDLTPRLVALLERCATLNAVSPRERDEFAAAARTGVGRQVAYDVVRGAYVHATKHGSTTSQPLESMRTLLQGSTVRVGLIPAPTQKVC